jgi:formate hydrogenlyase subunit 6/NADH:ubiquinone oxidoreductase subunit I
MWSILKVAFRTGVVTRPFDGSGQPAPGLRGRLMLDDSRCTGSGACARVCPSSAITVTTGPDLPTTLRLDHGACLFCGRCVEVCEAGALAQSEDYALSALRREDLVLTVVVGRSGEAHE